MVSMSRRRRYDIARAVRAAGGTVELTARGHLKVTGPCGVAFVGVHGSSWRNERNARTLIRRAAGLEV
jgi:hypothetical protein